MPQFSFCRYVVLTSLRPPPTDPNTFFYNRGAINIHNSGIFLGKGSDCWKMNFRNCCHQFIPPLNFPSPSCLLTLAITLQGWYRKFPGELCAKERSTDTGTHFETGPQMWYTEILGLETFFLLMRPPRNASEISQESVLPAAGPQALEKVLQGLCKGRVALAVIVREMWTYSRKNSTGCGFQFSV